MKCPFCPDTFTSHHGLSIHTSLNHKGASLPPKSKRQGLFLCAWLGTHTSTMPRDVVDIHGDRADFASGEKVVSFFIGLLWREEGLLAFWEGALSPAQKAKVKRLFFRENKLLKGLKTQIFKNVIHWVMIFQEAPLLQCFGSICYNLLCR